MTIICDPIYELYANGFRQQHESTCGPASVILAAHALGLNTKLESDWRAERYNEYFPVDKFLDRGMSLHELHVISELLYAGQIEIQSRRAYKHNISVFRKDIENAFNTMESVIIINFRQNDFIGESLHPLRNPHYSPIMGWDENNQVLIADVDRTLNFAYWLDIGQLFTSMAEINVSLGIPRGWLVITKLNNIASY